MQHENLALLNLSPSKDESSGQAEKNHVQDQTYWLNTGFSVFEAEGIQFRVPNYQFIKGSRVFAGMYTLPQGDLDKKSAIKLPGVSAQDFSKLLKVLYPLEGKVDLSIDEWLSVLRLSTMWYMLELRDQAISQLSSASTLSPAQKVVLGRELKVSDWFIKGCLDFVTRDKVFTEEEVATIGTSLCIDLFRIREDKWRSPKAYRDWRGVICDKLKDEIKDIAQDESGYQSDLKKAEEEGKRSRGLVYNSSLRW